MSSGRTRVSLFSGNQDRGACTWNPKAIGHGQKTEVSTCPNSHAAQLEELPAINVEAHGSESWFRPLVVFMARGPEVDHCHCARLQFSTKA